MRVWRNWQTRLVQVHMNASSCLSLIHIYGRVVAELFDITHHHQTDAAASHGAYQGGGTDIYLQRIEQPGKERCV